MADLVFARENGTAMVPETLNRVMARTVAGLGLPKIRLHDLRHGYATQAELGGVASSATFDKWRERDAARERSAALAG